RMSTTRYFRIAALVLFGLGGPSTAASPLTPLLGAPGDCYFRTYDEAHLKAHGDQRVTGIGLKYNDRFQDHNFEQTLDLVFTLRHGETYTVTGLCRGTVCGAEGDGGALTITPTSSGIRLDIDPVRGLGAEGNRDYSGNLY